MNKPIFKLLLKAALVVAPMVSPIVSLAEPSQEWRCSVDSLTPDLALQRLDWARRCGLTQNSGGPGTEFASGAAAGPPPTFATLWEYAEGDPNRAYSGNSNAYQVNYYYGHSKFVTTFQYTQALEASGPTMGFWKWTAVTAVRPRPLYPSFDTMPDGSGIPLIPLPSMANDCNLYQWNPTAGTLTPWTGNFYVMAYCESSCYAPDQSLRFSDGDVNIVKAMKAKRDDLVTLSPDATLDNLHTQTSKVFSYTTEIRDAEHVIFNVTTASGGKLRVTNEHPMVTSEGRLVKAESLAVGDELLKADGTPDRIASIEKSKHFGKVYNIKPASLEPVANVLIAQGYLVGSARFQNDDVAYINRVLLFRAVPDKVMPR
jgi:hypothetical protein